MPTPACATAEGRALVDYFLNPGPPHKRQIRRAARMCAGCPLLAPCRAQGAHETGLWGGVIRTRVGGRRVVYAA